MNNQNQSQYGENGEMLKKYKFIDIIHKEQKGKPSEQLFPIYFLLLSVLHKTDDIIHQLFNGNLRLYESVSILFHTLPKNCQKNLAFLNLCNFKI